MNEQDQCIIPDTQLMDKLREYFAGGAQEVEVQHPTEGSRIVTKADFLAIQRMMDAKDGSPAKRVLAMAAERRRLELKFCETLNHADVRHVCESDAMGVDAFGQLFEIEGLTFVPVQNYPARATALPAEFGLLFDEQGKRQAVRLVSHDGVSH